MATAEQTRAEMLQELIEYWGTDEGKPYKNELINVDMYLEDKDDLGCMCAQGQILTKLDEVHYLDLEMMTQTIADRRVSELLNISLGHSILLRAVNDSVDGAPASVLTNPGEILGPNYTHILAFWHYLERGLHSDSENVIGNFREAACQNDLLFNLDFGYTNPKIISVKGNEKSKIENRNNWIRLCTRRIIRNQSYSHRLYGIMEPITIAVVELASWDGNAETKNLKCFGIKSFSDLPKLPKDYGRI